MAEVKRPYDASGRQQRARERRRAVVTAAQELFERDGFRRTTIAAIAARAGVSPESIYKGFGSKAALAKVVFDVTIAGDDEDVPVARRAEADAIRAEPDILRKIARYVEGVANRIGRSAGVQLLIRDGRHVDDSLAPVWRALNEERLAAATLVIRHLADTGGLRPGLAIDEAQELLWNYTAVDHYERLVLERGWTLERYTAWLIRAVTAALSSEGGTRKGGRGRHT